MLKTWTHETCNKVSYYWDFSLWFFLPSIFICWKLNLNDFGELTCAYIIVLCHFLVDVQIFTSSSIQQQQHPQQKKKKNHSIIKVNKMMIDNPIMNITQSTVDVIHTIKSNWWNASDKFTMTLMVFVVCWPYGNMLKKIFHNYPLELFHFDRNRKQRRASLQQ